jgi:transcriptional antiterminator RfaH
LIAVVEVQSSDSFLDKTHLQVEKRNKKMNAMNLTRAASDALNIEFEADTSEWFAICTNPKQEDRAYHNLQAWNIECFYPRIQEGRRNQFTGAVSLIARPLFPRYIFARFKVQSSLRKVRFTRGVLRVVSFNLKPIPIDNEVIEFMRSRVASDGFIKLGEELKLGDKVRIKNGPWGAIVGIVDRCTQADERVQILLTAINYQGRLMIERQWLEKID